MSPYRAPPVSEPAETEVERYVSWGEALLSSIIVASFFAIVTAHVAVIGYFIVLEIDVSNAEGVHVTETIEKLGVYYNDCDYVVASSPDEALRIWADAIGENPDNGYSAEEWRRLDDNKVVRGDEDESDSVGFESLTCAEWAARKGGRKRLLFSDEY